MPMRAAAPHAQRYLANTGIATSTDRLIRLRFALKLTLFRSDRIASDRDGFFAMMLASHDRTVHSLTASR
jgi:hypothetical protein